MHIVLKDAISQSGVSANREMADSLMTGFELVRYLIEQSSPDQWRGRTGSASKDHIADFLKHDPIFTALHTSLFAADQENRTNYAPRFESDAHDVLVRVHKLTARHPVEPQELKNVERAYLCILYMNTLEGIDNPVRDTLVGSQADIYRQLLSEINRCEIDKVRETRAYEVILEYAEQVACLENPSPRGAAWLRHVWKTLEPQTDRGEVRDFRSDLGELREDLCAIVTTLNQVEQYCAGTRLNMPEENALAISLLHLNQRAGLRHLARSEMVQHLVSEGIGNAEKLTHLINIALVLDKGVSIPQALRQGQHGRSIIALAASGAFFVPAAHEPENLQIAMRFDMERQIGADSAFCEALNRIVSDIPLMPANHQFAVQVYNFYRAVRAQGPDQPVDEIVHTGCRLRQAGLLNGQTSSILKTGHCEEYPLQGYTFLKNVATLLDHHVAGVPGLHRSFAKSLEERIGAMAEAAVAVCLLQHGHQVMAVRRIGAISGHVDYDVVARIGERIYGIEVKSTVEALQQKNFTREGRVDNTQLYKLTRNAALDHLLPAVICWDLRGASVLRSALRSIWNEVASLTKTTGEPMPVLFDRSGKQFHI